MDHQLALLLGSLHLDEAHARPGDGLADRLSVGRIVLLSLQIGLHIRGRHELHLVAQLGQPAAPVMRRSAGLDADQAAQQLLEERDQLGARELRLHDDLALSVDAVDLKHRLGDPKPTVTTSSMALLHLCRPHGAAGDGEPSTASGADIGAWIRSGPLRRPRWASGPTC